MQTRIVAILMICLVALSGATAVSGGVSYTSLDSMNENNVTEVSVNATPAVSNSKQRRQYRLSYVSWKNRIADLRMSAIFKWLRTEYYPSLVSIADAASSGSSGVSFARDSMTIQDAWWDLDETIDMDLHRDSMQPRLIKVIEKNRDTRTYVEVDYGLNEPNVYQATCYGTSTENHGYYVNADRYKDIISLASYPSNWCPKCQENHDARDSKQLLKDMPRLPVFSRLEILEMARKQMIDNGEDLDKVNDWNDVVLPVNRFNFFKQLDIISDWACGEYGYGNVDDDSEINSWKMPFFSGNGIDDRERRGSLVVTISKRGLEVANALHQMKVAQEVLDGARDSKYMVVSSQDGNTFGACEVRGSGKYRFVQFRGSQTYPADQIRFKNKDEAIEFLCRTSGNYFWVKSDYYVKSWWNGVDDKLYNNMCVSFWETLEDHRERGANNASLQSKYNARDSAENQNIDRIEELNKMKRMKIEHFYDLQYLAKCANERLEYARMHLGSIVKRIDELDGYLTDEDRRFLDEPRDSADSDSHTIDLTPSKSSYGNLLMVVIKDSPKADDVEWATNEYIAMFGIDAFEAATAPRDSAWDDEKLSYAIELLSEKDLVKYQEWVDSQDGEWNGDGTISFANANAKLDHDMRKLRHEKLQDIGYCRETELLLCNLERHGFTLVGHRPYGDNLIKFNRTRDDEGNMPSNHYDIQNIIYDCWNHEETTLIVNHPSRGDREIGILLVYGNEFGVLAADYSAPREYGSRPEWYVALKSACNTDIDGGIEEYEAITGSSMEYRWNDNLGRVSGKITFDDMMEDGNYKYKLCPECLKSGHENNQSYCHRYGASLSNGETGSCIGYPNQEIARDSAEMAALVPSRYDDNVSARELHPNVNSLNPDGFKWSDEQVAILNDFAWWFEEYQNGTKTSRPRMVIESVAGSGKTTLVKELLSIINRFDSATKTIASAFNVHIAKILKDEIKDQQKNGFRGLETLGNSNSVSAGGYDIIRSHLKSQGITNVGMESSVEGKYLVLSKIVLSEYFAMISKPDGVKNANVGEVIRIMKEVCEYSQAAKPNYRNQYMKLARDLKKFVEALMGQGFVPTRSESKDLKEIRRIYEQIALVQGLSDTVLLKLPKNAMFTLARDVLLRSMDTWNSEKEVFPFAWTSKYSFSDCIVARVSGFAESGNFERARFDSNNLYPLWKTLTRDVWDDNKLKTNMLFDHLSKAGLIWPPRGKESGRPTVSAPRSGKPACEVWVKGNQMSVSFRDGLAASSKIDGSRACDFLKYNGIISQWPRNNLNAGKYNESIVKKLETKFKSAKGGFKLHGDSSADIVIEESRSKVTVSFSDHTWLPIALNLEPSADVKKDMAFVDEIQDLSVAKGSLIRKLIRNDGDSGLVLVGDSRQSIMQFSGSSATSMTDNATASNCVSYPMTICWRGSHEVAHSANRVMSNVLEEVQALWPKTDFPDYLSHKSPSIPSWNVGKPMENVGTDKLVPMVKELQEENPDVEIAVLSRVNQPLGAVILDLVTNGIGITTPRGEGGIVNSIKPILTNKYVEPKSPSQGIGIDMDNTNFKDLRSVRNRLEQVVSWAFNQSMIRNKGDADAAAKDEKFVTIEGNAELAIALIELWFREGVPSSTKHKDFVDWFKNVLLSSSGNPVHVSSVHRFKGGECDYAFILRSAKGKPDKETGECMPREIFMNKSMNDAPENAIAEACIMYVALTRSKSQNIQLWYELSGEEEAVQDPTRCVDCNAITHPDDHAVCIGCNRLLCNEYKPLRGPQGGLLHKGGEFDTTLSCGEFLPRNADDFFDFTSTERSERNKHERYCDSCWENAPRDSNEIIHYTPNGNILTADECLCAIDCVECGEEIDLHEEDTMGEHCLTCYWLKREVIDADDYEGNKEWDEIRLIARDSAECDRNDTDIAEAMKWTRSLAEWIDILEEENDWIDEDGKPQPHGLDDTMLKLMLVDVSKIQMSLIRAMEDQLYRARDEALQLGVLIEKEKLHSDSARDSNDIRHELEQAGILPANGATRVCANCDKQAVFDVDTAIGTRSFCSEKCYAEYNGLEVMDDPNFYGMMLITRKPIETVYEVHLWTREIEGKKLGEFDEFFKFKNEDSARKLYNQITDYTYKILMQYDGDEGDVLLEYDNHDPHENMGHRDSADFCNTCDAHIDLQGRDMLPRGMCIDCFIAQCREEMGVPNPIVVTDNWPENDPDEEPRDSCCEWCSDAILSEEDERYIRGEMICKDCEESWHEQPRDSYRRKAKVLDKIMAWHDRMQLESDSIAYELDRMNWMLKNPDKDYDDYPYTIDGEDVIRDSSEFVTITLEEMDNFLVDAQGFRRLNPDEVGHYCGEWVYEYYLEPTNSRIRVYSSIPVAIHNSMNHNSATRGKGKDAIRCILLTGSTSVGVDEKCIGKATSTKRITLWRLNLLKKYEQWIWDALA